VPGPLPPPSPRIAELLDRAGWRVALLDGHVTSGRREAVGAVVAVARDRGLRVAHHAVVARAATPAQVAAGLRRDLAGVVPARGRDGLIGLSRDLAARSSGPVLLVIDDVHRGERVLVDALVAAALAASTDVRLLVAGAALGSTDGTDGFAELGVVHLDVDELTGRDGSEAAPGLADLRTAAMADLDADDRRLLAVLAHLGLSRPDAVASVGAGHGSSAGRLARVPGVVVGAATVDIDPRWTEVLEADPDDLRRAAAVTARMALAVGDAREAARLAVAGRATEELRTAVRSVLATQPPRVGARELRRWRDSGVLPPDDPHAEWLDAVTRASQGAPLDDVYAQLVATSRRFDELGDHDAAVAVGMAGATVARRRDDTVAILGFIGRAHELAAAGVEAARWSALVGEALAHQMSGDPAAALRVLEEIPPDALGGDWAAQVAMMRGTNHLLAGDLGTSVALLEQSTGWGGDWSYATALQLLATARWMSGDAIGAVRDLEVAEAAAAAAGARSVQDVAMATRAAFVAAHQLGDDPNPARTPTAVGDPEAARLFAVAAAMTHLAADDVAAARAIVEQLDPPERSVRSTSWTASLGTALGAAGADRWADVAARHPALAAAVEAGHAGRLHLETGRPAPRSARPYLPSWWCEPVESVVELRLVGSPEVHVDGRPVEHRSWERARVRELSLYLAVVPPASRDLAAERLWPELSGDAAQRNLRVTLTYLLDVIDPGRPRGGGSRLIAERGGTISLAEAPWMRVDLRDEERWATRLLTAAAAGDGAGTLAAARGLDRGSGGRTLAGAAVGAWFEPFESRRHDRLLGALAAGAEAALEAGEAALAERLAERGLTEDPWAERLHQLAIRARMERDDLDGARRALRRARRALDELGLHPEAPTRRLARDLGVVLG